MRITIFFAYSVQQSIQNSRKWTFYFLMFVFIFLNRVFCSRLTSGSKLNCIDVVNSSYIVAIKRLVEISLALCTQDIEQMICSKKDFTSIHPQITSPWIIYSRSSKNGQDIKKSDYLFRKLALFFFFELYLYINIHTR